MKYSMPFYNGMTREMIENLDDVMILFDKSREEEYKELKSQVKRLTLYIRDPIDEEGAEVISRIGTPLMFSFLLLPELIDLAREKKLYMINADPIQSLDVLRGALELGAKEVDISGELAFSLPKISPYIRKFGAKVRVCPNRAVGAGGRPELEVRKFFIPPEGLSYYKDYIDFLLLMPNGDESAISREVTYNVYKNMKAWNGDFSEIAQGLDVKLNTMHLIPGFYERRLRCDKKCFKGGDCDFCAVNAMVAETAEKIGLTIVNK